MYRTLSALVVSAAAMASPAVAQSLTISATAPSPTGSLEVRSMTISFADADPATAQGAAILLDRIDAAARAVCGEREGQTMRLARAKIFDACRARVVHYAVKEVDAPQLTQRAATR